MKRLPLLGLIIFPLTVSAQDPAISANVQEMMERLQHVQDCFKNINPSLIDDFKQKSQQAAEEVKALCAAGKRDAAKAFAKKFNEETEKSDLLRQMKNCTKGMQNKGPKVANPLQDENKTHICDN